MSFPMPISHLFRNENTQPNLPIKKRSFVESSSTPSAKKPKLDDTTDQIGRKTVNEIKYEKKQGLERRNALKAIKEKTIHLISVYNNSYEVVGKTVTMFGKVYSITLLGNGKNHEVYQFNEDNQEKNIIINDVNINLTSIVLKVPSSKSNDQEKSLKILRSIEGYARLKVAEVPQAEVYSNPLTFVDPKNIKNGQFFLVEKMEERLPEENSLNDPVVFEFVKKWLTESAIRQCTIIEDFRPANVMKNSKGEVVVIDPDLPDSDEFNQTLWQSLKNWAGENEEHFKALIADFPDKLKNSMLQKFQTGCEAKHIDFIPSSVIRE